MSWKKETDRKWCYNADDHQEYWWYAHDTIPVELAENPFATFEEISAHYAAQGKTLIDGVPPWWQEDDVRRERNKRLEQDVDAMNPIRWDAMTDTEKQSWRDYRQALLDVPSQSNLYDVTWPTKP